MSWAIGGVRDMSSHFQDWCLRTYGDSGKTKTVTRMKHGRIVELLSDPGSTDNPKFKFWVKSKGFQLGLSDPRTDVAAKPAVYVPVKTTTGDGVTAKESISLKRVAVVEDFFDIIYSMHVETGTETGRTAKHAGQKRTYKADGSSVSSDDFDMSDTTWISADQFVNSDISPSQEEKMHSPQNLHNQEDDDSSSECCSGNGSTTLNPVTSNSAQGGSTLVEVNGNSSTGLEYSGSPEEQPVNLSERFQPAQVDNGSTDGQRIRAKYMGKGSSDVRLNKLDVTREYASKSPPYSSGGYDSGRNELLGTCPEDLSMARAGDDDDDDHDDHEDNEKINDSEGKDPERLKAFNMFVRLFVDENLDRMVPISKQPKEKIQAIIESCSRQFPEFQERARKRLRTYLKSCRRMKKNGIELTSRLHASSFRQEDREEGASNFFMSTVGAAAPPSASRKRTCWRVRRTPGFPSSEARPTPPHLTSAMAENILAAACESESRKAAKRMRLESYQQQDEPIALDKQTQQGREAALVPHSAYPLPTSTYSQDQMYINGGLNYTYRGYSTIGGGLQAGSLSNGPTDLSMKALASNSTSSSTGSSRSVAATQLSPTEISAVRQLIAGYRESAAFLLRSADELENLILQQN
ncbi:nucleolar protein 4-like b isoform X3 [Rhinoraja longicauda]